MTNIGGECFENCLALENVYIADGTDRLTIEENIFKNCQLKEAYLGRTVNTKIFNDNKQLSSVTIGNYVTELPALCFRDCKALETISIPANVANIGEQCFDGCEALKEITIPASVKQIGKSCFRNCLALENVYIADGTDKLIIGELIFSNCQLKEVYLGRTFRYDFSSSYNSPFFKQSRLSTVTISNIVTELPTELFYSCTLLSSIVLPASIEYIDSDVFYDCERLNNIYCLSTTPPIAATDMCDIFNQATLHVPNGSLEAYKQDITWGKFKNIVEFDPTGIADGTVTPGGLSLWADGGTLHVDGLPQGTPVEVYTTDGKLVYQGTATDVALPEGNLYIVRAAGQTSKIIL